MLEAFSMKVDAAHPLSRPPSFVSAEACIAVLDWRDAAERLKAAYSIVHPPGCSPPRVMATTPSGALRVMAAAPPDSVLMGAKLFGHGSARRTNYAILLVEQVSGQIVAIVDGAVVTAVRTAVTSSLAVDRLCRQARPILAILGSGTEAQSHLAAIASLRAVAEVRIYSPTKANREAFAERAERQLSIPARAFASVEEAVAGADIVVAAARSRDETPILMGDWLPAEVVVVSVGSTVPSQREIDSSVIALSDLIVCDAIEEVIGETGDMLAAARDGVRFDDKVVSLNDLLSGHCDIAADTGRRLLFKSVGNGLQDVVVAQLAYEKALARGLTQALPEGFYVKG